VQVEEYLEKQSAAENKSGGIMAIFAGCLALLTLVAKGVASGLTVAGLGGFARKIEDRLQCTEVRLSLAIDGVCAVCNFSGHKGVENKSHISIRTQLTCFVL
jgi:hypothetical protein